MAWDVIGAEDPNLGVILPGHRILLARTGIYIIENLQLEELAAAGQHRFFFICVPLKFVGATGSPVRPLAIVSGDSGSWRRIRERSDLWGAPEGKRGHARAIAERRSVGRS